MKVVFCIPALDGSIKSQCTLSLFATQRLLHDAKIPYEVFIISSCPYLPTARNTLVAMFMADPEATDLFFIDSDVGFEATAVIKILERPESIVAGIYPLKRDAIGYPVEVKTIDGIPIGRDGLIEADFLPTGFMRIKRIVFEKLAEAYPHLKYADSVVEVLGTDVSEAYDFFHMGIDPSRQRWTTEDYAFCQRWRDIGGRLWVYPDIHFQHVGTKAYSGNYHRFLLRQAGGANEHLNIERALEIEGWMESEELEWLAEQAAKHERIVEIGSYFGRSTRALADNTKGTVIAIDNWQGPKGISSEKQSTIEPGFRKNLSDHMQSGRLILNPAWNDHKSVDMVFIDGDHDQESVERDIRAWQPRIAEGGLLCGHDIYFDGVAQAVKRLLPEAKTVSGTSLWYWQGFHAKQKGTRR